MPLSTESQPVLHKRDHRWEQSVLGSGSSLGWPPAPCTTLSGVTTFSSNTGTAYQQGYGQAQSAYNTETSLGMGSRVPVNYDLEPWNTSNGGCVAATQSFVAGWSAFFVFAGVYGSRIASGLADLADSSPPQHIWGAQYDGDSNTANMDNLGGLWMANQRLKQYQGNVCVRENGLTMAVDEDCVDGPLYSYPPS